MSPWAKSWGTRIGLASLPLLSLSIHAALLDVRLAAVALILGAMQAAALAWLVGSRLPGRGFLAVASALLFVLAAHRASRTGLLATTALTHATAYATLLAVFGSSLRPGRRPVATALADALHGPLRPEVVAYTRRVTVLWVCVFAGQLAASALLLGFGSTALWSLFVNVLDLPLIALVFLAEFAWRRWRFPDAPLVPIGRIVAASRAMRPGARR